MEVEVAEHILHESLVRRWGVGKTHGHPVVLVEPKGRHGEGSSLLVPLRNLNLVVARFEIKHREILGTGEGVQQLFNPWEAVAVLHGAFVEPTVVNTLT